MSPDNTEGSTSFLNHSNWYSVRPWAPSLTLSVREITSVSATFILSSTLNGDIDSSLASIGLDTVDTEEPYREDLNGNQHERKSSSVVADALAKGLSVNVNGSAWPRAFIRIDDQLDEAVIIIYALMPGRQYDIELALASTDQSTVARRQVTTEEADHETEIHTDPESPTLDNSTSSDPHSTPSTSPSRTIPGTPPSVAPPITLEDKLNQLQLTLSAINAERETLLASLKSARRDAQKADSALRSEIDTLKRASEKNIAAELKGKQKVLALQESVKRAHNSTKELQVSVEDVESMLPELNAEKEKKEIEHLKIKAEADQVRKKKEELEEKERKRIDTLRAELAGLTNKLEKLGGKREKLETIIIPDLETKLQDVANEIELEEQEYNRLEAEEMQVHIHSHRIVNGRRSTDEATPSYVLLQRPQHASPGPIGRPVLTPVQRPTQAESSFLSSNSSNGHTQSSSVPLWAPARSVQAQVSSQHDQGYSHNPRSSSLQQNTSAPTIMVKTPRRSSLKSNATTTSAPASFHPSASSSSFSPFSNSYTTTTTSSPTTSSLSSSPTRNSPQVSAAMSALSTHAPAFEPRERDRQLKTNGYQNNFNPTPGLIQRPSPVTIGSNRHTPSKNNSQDGQLTFDHSR